MEIMKLFESSNSPMSFRKRLSPKWLPSEGENNTGKLSNREEMVQLSAI